VAEARGVALGSTDASSLYDAQKRESMPLPVLAGSRHGHLAVPLPDGVLVLGGYDHQLPVNRFWSQWIARGERYDVASQSWVTLEVIGAPANPRGIAVQIAEGRVLFVENRVAYVLVY
jgi:hypothetical protein